jgi:hypothetical protein
MKKFERNEMARIDWLDKLTFREIEKINEVRTAPRCMGDGWVRVAQQLLHRYALQCPRGFIGII